MFRHGEIVAFSFAHVKGVSVLRPAAPTTSQVDYY